MANTKNQSSMGNEKLQNERNRQPGSTANTGYSGSSDRKNEGLRDNDDKWKNPTGQQGSGSMTERDDELDEREERESSRDRDDRSSHDQKRRDM